MRAQLEHVRVSDCMHHGILSCSGDAPLGEVAGMMAKHRVHAVAVTNGDGRRVVAIVSDLDVAAAAATGRSRPAGGGCHRAADDLRERADASRGASDGRARCLAPGGGRRGERIPVGILSTLDIAVLSRGRDDRGVAPVATLDLARTQFGVTTLFHFIFVPMSIGLAAFVALCQTQHYRTGREVYLRMTNFWGKFMLISMAIGVVTGIVQEFQFGMNWSLYSTYVGDIFGAPLAIEGLIAFFLESTFLGLWIFGWDRLSPKLHLACALDRVDRHDDLGLLHPRRELVDAAPGRLRSTTSRTGRAEGHLRRAHQLDRAARLPAHDLSAPSPTGGMLVSESARSCSLRGNAQRGRPQSLRMALPISSSRCWRRWSSATGRRG